MITEQLPQRKDYMEGKVDFATFYRSVAKEARISFQNSPMLPRVRAALKNGDAHLNTIPLREWDALAVLQQAAVRPALKAHGDFWSLSGGVCVAKQAARDAVEQEAAVASSLIA